MLIPILITVFATLVLVVFAANLTSMTRRVQHKVEHLYGVDDPQFVRTMDALLAPGLVEGNDIQTYENGDNYFPLMLDDIKAAQKTVTIEMFIFWSGEVGEGFADALIERARAGCRVHALLDWVGSMKASRSLIRKMRDGGVNVAMFRPPRIVDSPNFNNRTHRKILVVDGCIGWTGGAGIADSWRGKARNKGVWRDSMYRVQGPVVAQLQSAFMDNWLLTRAEVLHSSDYYPELTPMGPTRAQIFISGPEEGVEGARIMYLLSIAAAKERILLDHAYFVPDDLCVQALIDARERGVHIEVIIPGPTDAPITMAAMRSRMGKLLQAGVRFYRYETAMFHRKAMVVDHCWVSVGSANFDTRSFRLNDEVLLNVADEYFAEHMSRVHEADLACTTEVTLEDFNARPKWQKLADWTAGLFRSQM